MPGRSWEDIDIPAWAWERPQTQRLLRDRDVPGLLRLAQAHGASQTRIASATGIAQGRVSEILSGKRTVGSLQLIERIADGLGMPDHARILFGLAPRSPAAASAADSDLSGPLRERLDIASVDQSLIGLFEAQTQNLRLIDRKLGAHYLLAQSQAHVRQMHDLLRHSLPGPVRRGLAQALAEAASLTGWQALDSGRASTAWRYYEIAKAAARESDDATVLAHVSAEQVYVLLDSGREREALATLRAARNRSGTSLPALLSSWLWAAEGEVHAALGHEAETQRALEHAFSLLPPEPHDPSLPFLMLDHTHLLRWRGHCLAHLGHDEAIEDLTRALDGIAPLELGRAEAGLRTDLALAYAAHGDTTQAHRQARRAAELSDKSGSVRQRTRLARLLPQRRTSGGENVE
ncbi:helix-turn-helix transcriptional regulator [Nocardiopsis lambiniae]|uniref:Helix-turn-helix transcriptional regulator n=1 Tax=Nocardiopsis lambiniae TaxID=3075539 RepID=A0ABU2MHJ6_9ACTN|nr:helix-turn-helix transcriptional regulator [Nocardiopsis sp. DSM 44743]MDT0332005.1 helix-turn-helix transcriptional regulator [Nocardiopsis sp. DSM 44743]